jgi:hypothetical protein
MAQPPRYRVSNDDPAEDFGDIQETLDAVLDNLALLQRDDGELKNAIVKPDSLSTATKALIAGDWNPRGAWVTNTEYEVGDMVVSSGATYVCAVRHVSDNFGIDLAALRWMALADAISIAQLTSITGASLVAATDKLPVYDDSASETKGITLASFADWIIQTYAGFTQSGTATSENLQAWARRKGHDVQSYGATGDGTTNDAAAIAKAITAAGVGGTVYFPKASSAYLIGTTSLTALEGQHWIGEGQSDSNTGTVIKYTGSGNAIESASRSSTRIWRVKITDIELRGSSQTASSCGIDLRRMDKTRLERVKVSDFDIGVRFDGTGGGYRNFAIDCEVIGNNTNYQVVNTANEQFIIGGRCTNGDDYGLDVQDGNSVTALNVNWESNGVHVKTASASTRVLGGRMESATTYRWQTTSAAEHFWIEGVHLGSGSGQAYLDEGKFSTIREIDRNAVRGMNLIRNGGFEVWSAGTTSAPDRWSIANATIARDTDMQEGSYSALIDASTSGGLLFQDVPIPTGWRDARREYLVTCRVKLGTSTQAALLAAPQDSGGTTQGSALLPTRETASGSRSTTSTAGWHTLYLVVRPNSSAVRIRVACEPDKSGGNGTAYFDAVCCMPLGGWHEEFYENNRDLAPKLDRILVSSKTHDFDATDGGTTTLTVPGAASGDDVLVTAPHATADVNVRGYVSGADTVTLVKTGAGDPGSVAYGVLVFKR